MSSGLENQFLASETMALVRGCKEKRRLLDEFVERAHAVAVQAELLQHSMESGADKEFSWAWNRIEQAKISFDIARLAVSAHCDEHGCMR